MIRSALPLRRPFTIRMPGAIVAMALALFAVYLHPSIASASNATPQQASQAIANQRAGAVLAHDKARFLATVDPQSSDAFKAAQSKMFDGLSSLPLSKYGATVTEADSGNLAPGLQLTQKYQADNSYLASTRMAYRLGAYDDRDAVDEYWYTYIERAGNWYVASDSDTSILSLDSATNLWDEGALSVAANDRVLVLTTPANAARGRQLLNTATNALATFDVRWTTPWNDKVVIIDPGSASEAARLVKTQGDIADFSAFTIYEPIQDSSWITTAPRVYAQDANLSKESADLQTQTLVHEFTHYAEAALAGPFTPTWAHEGSAEWIRLDKPVAVNPVVANPKLPEGGDFVAASSAQVQQAYKSATSAMAFVAALKGPTGPTDLFTTIGARRLNIGSPAYNVDQALQQATGLDTAAFTKAWDAKYPTPTPAGTTLTGAG